MAKAGTATELGTERIGKLLMQYAIPAIIAMTASSLYNMVDSIFIGHGVGPFGYFRIGNYFPSYESGSRLRFAGRRRCFPHLCLSDWDKKTMIPPNIFWAMSSP